jgi:hypothetical protein
MTTEELFEAFYFKYLTENPTAAISRQQALVFYIQGTIDCIDYFRSHLNLGEKKAD